MENEVQQNQQPEAMPTATSEKLTIATLLSTVQKNKKIIIALIAILFLVLASILFGVLYSKKLKNIPAPSTPQEPKQELYGSVMLTPVNVIGTPGKKTTVDVILNTDGKKISGTIVAVKYNPMLLENVTITPFQDKTSALGYSLKQFSTTYVDTTNGAVILTLKLPQGMQDLAGSGKIAEVSFTVKPIKVAVRSTSIELTKLTGFLMTNQPEHNNLTKNRVDITLPAGLKYLTPTPPFQK